MCQEAGRAAGMQAGPPSPQAGRGEAGRRRQLRRGDATSIVFLCFEIRFFYSCLNFCAVSGW